jgi:anhydro-N-acetylmuramic acid kinase
MNACQNKPYDRDGAYAKLGRTNNELLTHFLHDPYFSRSAPKSTGREYFNLGWIKDKLTSFNALDVSDTDVMRTLIDLTVSSITQALPDCMQGELLVFGGGAKNSVLMDSLTQALPYWQVNTTQRIGIDPDFMEACAFAWLAYACIQGIGGALPDVTGAERAGILGSVYR